MAKEKNPSNGGAPLKIPTIEKMMELWDGYKEQLKEKALAWVKIQYVGKDGERVTDPYKLPMTYEGFKIYCWENKITVQHYFENREGAYDMFCDICSRIKLEIRNDQITGGLLGVYNPSITQRLNGLTEKVEQQHSGEVKGLSTSIINVEVIAPKEDK